MNALKFIISIAFKAAFIAVLLICHAFADTSAEDNLKEKLAKFTSFSTQFNQSVTDTFGELLQTAEGKLYLKRPNLLHWQSLPPNELTLVADGTTVWYADPFAEQVIAMDQNHAAENHPIMLLADVASPQWQQYSVSQEDDQHFVLTAKSQDTDILTMTVVFKEGQLSEIMMLDSMEQVNKLQFFESLSNLDLSSELFLYSVPDGFDLDDQRSGHAQ